ncbi:probable calcium-binding protein CML22 [Andrographis paniculata]|uniref:probable calcium-binding protein CML22 n=1 Tax=Andrographis paniculata TaxID=175694 RepID=UPI0021E867AE|nr:probable calcium-binding protein CML22 [Andrographis paniculata]
MKDANGASVQRLSVLELLHNKLQGILCCLHPTKYKTLDAMLERKMMEMKRASVRVPEHLNFKTIDSVLIKFPQFREGFQEIRNVFQQYDEDSDGILDIEELKKCLHSIELNDIDEAEIDNLFDYCNVDGNKGMQFNEFIVLLCLVYLLMDSTPAETSKTNWPLIKRTFDAIVQVFLFLDKRGDGKLKRKDVVRALNEASPKEKSPAHITRTRFKEMDWDRNGRVSFKEFIYSFISWVGTEQDSESPEQHI